MKRAAIVLATVWAAFGYAQAEDYVPVPKQLLHCTAPAFQGNNNDIRIRPDDRQRGKAVALPHSVAGAIDTATEWVTRPSRDLALWKSEAGSQADLDAMKCRDVYPLANVVNLRNGLKLYAVHGKSWVASWLLLIVYDPVTGKATPKPAYVNLKWATADDPLLKRPFITTADLRGDGHWQLVVEERGHNGTVYNATVYRYFDIGADLKLTNVLALETRVLDPLYPPDAKLLRTLTSIDATHLRINQIYSVGKKRVAGGYAVLESSAPGVPYRVVERHGVKKLVSQHFMMGDGTLITLSEEDDDEFLKQGYGLYY